MARTVAFERITNAVAVTPSDTDYLPATNSIYVGTTGDLAVEMLDGATVTFTGIAANVFHPLAVRRVLSTGTTATDIIAGY